MIKRKTYSSVAALAVCAILILLLIFEDKASSAARESLTLVIERVLPPLFPYMVISSVIISLDLLEPLYSLVPTEKLFRLPRCTAQVILCGLLCGFPIGAAGAARLCGNKRINAREAGVLCAISSYTSPAFLVGTVGKWWGSGNFGVYLFVMQILFCFISGIVLSRICLPKNDTNTASTDFSAKSGLPSALCNAIHDASLSCLAITGYIVFFRVSAVLLSSVLPVFAPIFTVLFEFSCGSLYGAQVGGILGAALTGFAVGYSGLAVLMQCCNFTASLGVPMKYYICTKIAEGAFLAAGGAVYASINPLSPVASTFSPQTELSLIRAALIIFALLATFLICSRCRKRNYFTHGY